MAVDEEQPGPSMGGLDREQNASMRGRSAVFSDAATEVERVLRLQKNYYAVLKVTKLTEPSEVRSNYFRLSRIIHPDKNSHPQAAEASAVANSAYDTLTNTIKKRLYDMYVEDPDMTDKSYAEWEAEQAAHPVEIPAWMAAFLRIPGGGICLLLILFPLTLLLILLLFILWLVCLPVRCCIIACCGQTAQPEDSDVPPMEPANAPDPTSPAGPSLVHSV